MPVDLILKYFPDLTLKQVGQYSKLEELYSMWNSRINLISRKDMVNLYERHILHSLAIARVVQFKQGDRVLDAGTGGGFPGIPLAIMFPDSSFNLVDSTAKKLTAVTGIADALGLKNVSVMHERLESLSGRYDFVVSRALASIPQTIDWVMKNVAPGKKNDLSHGLIYLKGGDFSEELDNISYKTNIHAISDFFTEEFFQTKRIVYIIR